jgi:hypothetical protein
MRKRGLEERGPIGGWLVQSRGRFHTPEGERWTADDFLSELRGESGWAPVRTTYARWESGAARPSDSNLATVVAFYAKRGVPGPFDAAPRDPDPDSDLARRAVVAAERQAEAAMMQAQLMARQVAALERIAAQLTGEPVPDPSVLARSDAFAQAALDAIRRPQSRPTA